MSKSKLFKNFVKEKKQENIIEVDAVHLWSFVIETWFDITTVKEFDQMIKKHHKIALRIIKHKWDTQYETCFVSGNYEKWKPTHQKIDKIKDKMNKIIVWFIVCLVVLFVYFVYYVFDSF